MVNCTFLAWLINYPSNQVLILHPILLGNGHWWVLPQYNWCLWRRAHFMQFDYQIITLVTDCGRNQLHRHFLQFSFWILYNLHFVHSSIWWQFDDIGLHGTKVIIYNLWFNDDGDAELDFESDPEVNISIVLYPFSFIFSIISNEGTRWLQDIRISGETKRIQTKHGWKTTNEQHIANKFHYSLRVSLL